VICYVRCLWFGCYVVDYPLPTRLLLLRCLRLVVAVVICYPGCYVVVRITFRRLRCCVVTVDYVRCRLLYVATLLIVVRC